MLKIKSNNLPIHNFTIYGERHCGTNFLAQYLPKIYESPTSGISGLQITWDYGWKHWFGFQDTAIQTNGHNTLFIGIVRDPYNWIMAMRRMPHHLRNWNGRMDQNPYKNDIDFLTSEIESYHQGQELKNGCKFGSDHHIQQNRRYKNIFELREVKNNYLVNTMPLIASNYILINYEILHTDIKSLVLTLSSNFNLQFKSFIENITNKKHYEVGLATKNIIDNNLNWETEKILGYSKRLG